MRGKSRDSLLETHRMKIAFIFCNNSDDAPSFPLGVGLLSSVLKKEGHSVKGYYLDFSDPTTVDLDHIADNIKTFGADLVAYSATSPAFASIKHVAEYMRHQLQLPSICGGIHPTLYPDDALAAPGIDYICVGEGERPLVQFVEHLSTNRENTPDIPGIWSRDTNGIPIKNRLYPLHQNLDDYPCIDYDVFGKTFNDKILQSGWQRYIMSRGCPYSCSYCHNKLIRKTYAQLIGCTEGQLGYIRSRSPESTIREIEEMVKRYDIKVINFMDDLFCFDKKRTLKFCRLFKEQLPAEVGYSIQTHLLHLDMEIIDALRESRCQRIVVGVESANPRILTILKRKTDPQMMQKKLEMLLGAKFPLGIWSLNILGNPTETKTEMIDTLSFNAVNLVDVCKFNFMAPYPGSDIYEFCCQKSLFSDDYGEQQYKDRYDSVLTHEPEAAAFLEKFFDIGHWYMNCLAPLDLRHYYEPSIQEAETIPVGKWQDAKERYIKKDRELTRMLTAQGRRYYHFLFQGKIIGKVIGLTTGQNA